MILLHSFQNQACRYTFVRSNEQVNEYDSHPRHIAIGDFNYDSNLDLAIVNTGSNSIGIFINLGNGTYSSQVTYSTGSSSIAIGHFNNDTFLDLVVTNYAINSIGVFLNHANGIFTEQILTSLGSSRPLAIATEHFNDDNLTDIVVINDGTYTVIILLSIGNGLLRIENNYEMGYDSLPYAILASDINQDKKIDLLIVNYGTDELVILLNNVNNSFNISKYSTEHNSHPSSITIGDFDNNQKLDVVVTNNILISPLYDKYPEINEFFYSTGEYSNPRSMDIADLNNDGFLDVIVANRDTKNIGIFINQGNLTFRDQQTYILGENSAPWFINDTYTYMSVVRERIVIIFESLKT